MPQLVCRDAFIPAIQGLDDNGLVLVLDAMHQDLAIFLELPHGVAHVFHAILVRKHRTFVDDLVDPDSRYMGVFLGKICIRPLGTVACKSLSVFSCHYTPPVDLFVGARPSARQLDPLRGYRALGRAPTVI